MKNHHHTNIHKPVLLEAVLAVLSPERGQSYLDLTAGYGGHAEAVLEQTQSPDKSVLVDRDPRAIATLGRFEAKGTELIGKDYLSALKDLSGRRFDMILMDIGVSSPHLDNPERGFSFSKAGPLDMRMDQRQDLRAEDIVNSWDTESLASIFIQYGEVRPKEAKRVAEAIEQARPIAATDQLAEVISKTVGWSKRKAHPATLYFQAIRLSVNGELEQLESALPLALDLLTEGGRLAVISFHSLEDRIVKSFFKKESSSGFESTVRLVNKKAIRGEIENVNNPRARSARLRAVVKINK